MQVSMVAKKGINNEMLKELMEEILSRLPVKSLIRLKTTCKEWRSLIESRYFIELHRRRHCLDYRDSLLVSRYTADENHDYMHSCASSDDRNLEVVMSTPLFDLGWISREIFKEWPSDFVIPDLDEDEVIVDGDPAHNCPYVQLFGPLSNGIYCIIRTDQRKGNRISVATSKIRLYNLATRESKTMNPFNPEMVALLSELARRPSTVEYGFGAIRNQAGIVVDYKVVVIVFSGRDYGRFSSFVYSLKRGSWEKVVDLESGTTPTQCPRGLLNEKGVFETPRFACIVVSCQQLFLNGSWHWLDELPRKSHESDRILRFDVDNEAFGFIQGPPHECSSLDYEHVDSAVLIIDNRLAIIYLPYVVREDHQLACVGIDVWVMMEYGVRQSWTKIYSCKNEFGRPFLDVIGLSYSTTTTKSRSRNGSNISIKRIFLTGDNNDTFPVLSWDGSQLTDHELYIQHSDVLWNCLGVSTYVETLESLTLPQS